MTDNVGMPKFLVKATWYRESNGSGVWLLSGLCPHCHRKHTHGGGSNPDPASIRYGLREPHCTDVDLKRAGIPWAEITGYELIPAQGGMVAVDLLKGD